MRTRERTDASISWHDGSGVERHAGFGSGGHAGFGGARKATNSSGAEIGGPAHARLQAPAVPGPGSIAGAPELRMPPSIPLPGRDFPVRPAPIPTYDVIDVCLGDWNSCSHKCVSGGGAVVGWNPADGYNNFYGPGLMQCFTWPKVPSAGAPVDSIIRPIVDAFTPTTPRSPGAFPSHAARSVQGDSKLVGRAVQTVTERVTRNGLTSVSPVTVGALRVPSPPATQVPELPSRLQTLSPQIRPVGNPAGSDLRAPVRAVASGIANNAVPSIGAVDKLIGSP